MQAPECLALIICDCVVEDVRTHNKCILNTYNRITAASFPAHHGRMSIFVSLTDGMGKAQAEIRMVRDGKPEPLIKFEGELNFTDPLSILDLTFDLRSLVIPEPGRYAVELYLNGQLKSVRRIDVVQVVPESQDLDKEPAP